MLMAIWDLHNFVRKSLVAINRQSLRPVAAVVPPVFVFIFENCFFINPSVQQNAITRTRNSSIACLALNFIFS